MFRVKKQKHLVIQHLENISGKVLDEYPEIIKLIIKGKAGIYSLYNREKLYYIGLASNLMGRLNTHLKDRHRGRWDRFSVYLTRHNEHMKELESLLLRITHPSGNKVGGKFIKSQNLRSDIYKLIKASNEDQIALLMGGAFAQRRRIRKLKIGKGLGDLAGIVEKRKLLKAVHKGKRYFATLRKDGTIGYKGEKYNSPTAVAKVVTGRVVNGWHFWLIKNEKNKWVKLAELRG